MVLSYGDWGLPLSRALSLRCQFLEFVLMASCVLHNALLSRATGFGKTGDGGSPAPGDHNVGKETIDVVFTLHEKLVDNHIGPQRFSMCNACDGGCCCGLGCLLLERLSAH